jgi:hypothetical protein
MHRWRKHGVLKECHHFSIPSLIINVGEHSNEETASYDAANCFTCSQNCTRNKVTSVIGLGEEGVVGC